MPTIVRVSTLLIGCLAGQALALDSTQAIDSYLQSHFAKEDGLPSGVVNVILQTRNGFLWVGTDLGLARFDGRHFTTIEFSRVQPEGLSRALAEGPDGDLWAGTNTGVLRIPSAALDQFGRLPAIVYHAGAGPGDTITALQFNGDGVLWAGTDRGLYRLERGAFSIVLPDVSVSRIEKASKGRLLIVTSDGFVEWDGGRLVEHRDIAARLGVSANQIFHVMEDHAGARWYCTAAGVAREVNGSMERLQPYGLHVGLSAYRAYEDPQGNVWLNLAGGLFRATGADYEPVPGVHARYIYADSDGDLWLGTNGDGLVRLKNRIARMFTGDDNLGLYSNAIMTVLDAGGGKLWIGSNCGGLALFDGHRFRTYSHKDGLSNACVFAVAADRNNDVWVGTYGGGLFRFRDGRFNQFSKSEGLLADVVLSILAARDGTLWVSTTDGISHVQDGHFRNYTTADGLSNSHVFSVFQDRHAECGSGPNVSARSCVSTPQGWALTSS